MDKQLMITGNWIDKNSHKAVSCAAEIVSGVNRNGNHYELINTDRREIIEGTYPVGTILTAKVQLVPETTVQESTGKSTLKINNNRQ